MRRINHYTDDSKAFLHSIGNALHGENKTTYLAMENDLYIKYDEYEGNLQTLERLSPLWPQRTPENNAQGTCAHDMYSREKKDISNLWESLKNANGGKTIKCPLCGVRDVTDLDHYAPRSIFPEYSVHPKNLIPTCHECNTVKDNVWLTKGGHRIVFNSYFDNPLSILVLLNSEIKIDQRDMPYVALGVNVPDVRPKGYGIMIRTLHKLDLIPLYWEQVNNEFQTEFIKLSAHINDPLTKQVFPTLEVCWQARKHEYNACLANEEAVGEVNVLLYHALVNSPEFDGWIRKKF